MIANQDWKYDDEYNQTFRKYNNYWHNGESVRHWPGRLGFNPRSNHTKDSKMVLDATSLNTAL